jgi:acetyl esterase
MPAPSIFASLRALAGQKLVDATWNNLARAAGRLPSGRPERHGVERIRDVPYGGHRDHTLDVYRPLQRSGPCPVVLYLHGGGFRILSKDTHWGLSLAFARRGYVVFTIDYRLAPQHPFPAAIEDSCAALVWVMENARAYGGDVDRLVITGESAGANLTTSVVIATSYERPEPWARRVWESGARPRAAIPTCGMLQVSDADRFARRKRLSAFVHDRLREVEHAYLPAGATAEGGLDLADPLLVLERGETPGRPLPPFLAGVGTSDPLLDDTRRLKAALDQLGVTCDVHYYPGEIHAFHALPFREAARAYWRETYGFLERHVHPGTPG